MWVRYGSSSRQEKQVRASFMISARRLCSTASRDNKRLEKKRIAGLGEEKETTIRFGDEEPVALTALN